NYVAAYENRGGSHAEPDQGPCQPPAAAQAGRDRYHHHSGNSREEISVVAVSERAATRVGRLHWQAAETSQAMQVAGSAQATSSRRTQSKSTHHQWLVQSQRNARFPDRRCPTS